MPQCIKCGEEFNPKRLQLGYQTCLSCGGQAAAKEMARRKKCVAPAFNKGAYQYITNMEMTKSIGR